MNKKGTEKILSVWWFFVIAVIGFGIVAGVLIYYSAEADVREVEADVLSGKIVNCISEQGFLKNDVFVKNFDIYSVCGLDKEVFSSGSNFYFRISVFDETGKLFRENIIGGDASFEKDCKIATGIGAKRFPKCVTKNKSLFFFVEGEIKKINLEVLAGSNQITRKVLVIGV